MRPVAFLIIVLGGLLAYEAWKGLQNQSTPTASSGSGSGAGSGPTAPIPSGPVSGDLQSLANAHSRITGIPAAVYIAVAQNESGGTGYCNAGLCGYFGQSYLGQFGEAGQHSFAGGAGQTPQLALFPSMAAAFDSWDRFLQTEYPSCWSSRQTPNAFIPCLVAHNYSGGDQSWTTTILGRIAGLQQQQGVGAG